jgi:hypothetical protein
MSVNFNQALDSSGNIVSISFNGANGIATSFNNLGIFILQINEHLGHKVIYQRVLIFAHQ